MRLITSFAPRSETITAISDRVRRGECTSVRLVEACLHRIDELEPQVRAWVSVDRAGAVEQAQRLDAELAAGTWRGPLHGMPIGIKDIVDVAGFPTAAGSKLLANNIATRDATIVARLREAGAVILGKTVTTQFASFDAPETRNPWHLDRTPGGSSSGSAAAVACGMCYGAIGSQTGGSITRPASFCGVAGCKPTYGRVSSAGVMGLAPSMDHPGPIARTVEDLAILLDAIAGPDERDPLCSRQPWSPVREQLSQPASTGAANAAPRLGRLRGLFHDQADAATREMMDRTCDRLRAAGADIREVPLPESFADVIRSHRIIMAVEAAVTHRDLFARHASEFLPKIRGLIEEGLRGLAIDYARAVQQQRLLRGDMVSSFDGVDALLTPATLGPAPDATTTGDPVFNSPWSFTGQPTLSFPVAIGSERLPVAVQLIGEQFGEVDLFRVAAWCERTLAARSAGIQYSAALNGV